VNLRAPGLERLIDMFKKIKLENINKSRELVEHDGMSITLAISNFVSAAQLSGHNMDTILMSLYSVLFPIAMDAGYGCGLTKDFLLRKTGDYYKPGPLTCDLSQTTIDKKVAN